MFFISVILLSPVLEGFLKGPSFGASNFQVTISMDPYQIYTKKQFKKPW